MSKYDRLFASFAKHEEETIILTYAEIEAIGGVPLDHSFLKYKKELTAFGYQVKKISMKEEKVIFTRIPK